MERTVRLFICTACSFAALAAHVAFAETWYWSPTVKTPNAKGDLYYYWNNENNWTNTAAARSFPQAGDTAVLGWGSAGSAAYYVCDDNANYVLHEVRFEGNKSIGMNQGKLVLRGGGGGLKYMQNSTRTDNWMGMWLVGDGEVPIHVDKNVDYAFQTCMDKKSGNPTLVKTGPGKFICFNQAKARSYTVPLTLIRKGAFDITTESTISGVTFAFDGDDASQRICYCYRAQDALDLKWNNIGFYETNGVNNAAHGFSAQNDHQVKFTGTPKQNPTVFSGTFYVKAGLNWAPNSADYVFVCSNAVSATQGAIIVTKGTVKLVTGASFTALSRLNVAAGAVFDVEEGSGADFHADALALADATARLKLGAGVSLEIGAATLRGNALPAGVYSADGADGTRRAAWIAGAGTVTVLNGPANIDTWSGAGADALTSTDLNWASESAPDMTAGDLLATFATGGTAAALPAGTAAAFDGLVLDGSSLGGTAFAFTAGSGATASIGASGLTAAPASAATTWTMGWPITVAGGAQTWTIGANNTVKVNGPVGGDSALTLAGGGTVELNATSTHSGALTIDGGTVKVRADNALGTASRTVLYHFDTASLVFEGDVTSDMPINGTWGVNGSKNGGLKVADGANVTFNGKATFYSRAWVNVGAGATATFTKGLQITSNGMDGHLSLIGAGTVIITNSPLNAYSITYTTAANPVTLDLRVAENSLTASGRYWAEFLAGKIVTRVANALNGNTCLALGAAATFDLDGHDQATAAFYGVAGSKVVSARPATLTVNDYYANESYTQNAVYADTNRVTASVFEGNVSLHKRGARPFTFGAASSSTGTLSVAAGRLVLNASAAWPNCTNAVVSGGSLEVKNANAFGDADRAPGAKPKLVLDQSTGASLDLGYSGRIDCAEIHVDGVKRYGTFGAVGSGAENEVAWITGTGFIRALPTGTQITFR